jgi:CDP-diacylglycerol--serine O-phosphatidyltransferase
VAVQILPTLITLGNVLAGFLAVSYAVDAWGHTGDPKAQEALWAKAAWMVFVGMVCDALDGRVARLTGAESAFGASPDITCRVPPALLAKSLPQHALPVAAAEGRDGPCDGLYSAAPCASPATTSSRRARPRRTT